MSVGVCKLVDADGGADSSAVVSEDLFPELLERLRLSHHSTVQGLQLKVTQLRKERCLDAQKLEEFYKKNQNLREQLKVLQSRVKSGPCDRCTHTPTEEHSTQTTIHTHTTLQRVRQLECEREHIREENHRLKLELQHLRSSLSEPEEGVIPDSPQQPLSFPVVNKMKKRKRERRRVCYAETPIDVRSEAGAGAGPECDVRGVLVPDTCDLDVPGVPGRGVPVMGVESHSRLLVAETCALDLSCEQDSDVDPPVDAAGSGGDDSGGGFDRAESTRTQQSRGGVSPAHRPTSAAEPEQHPPMDRAVDQSWSVDPGAELSQYHVQTPEVGHALYQHPAGVLGSQSGDPDLTYVSHSLLLMERRPSHRDHPLTQLSEQQPGIGHRANDSLAHMFDHTTTDDYHSCPQEEEEEEEELIDDPHRPTPRDQRGSCRDAAAATAEENQSCPHEEEEEEEEEELIHRPTPRDQRREAEETSVACVMVVRKKAERRKLHGHTCKECETFYADLPESERKRKLSSCSRHRFRFIPPSTPENFWEVGFPSTQTCRERGYIKEDQQPPGAHRRRRRMPYLATFSPQGKAAQP